MPHMNPDWTLNYRGNSCYIGPTDETKIVTCSRVSGEGGTGIFKCSMGILLKTRD